MKEIEDALQQLLTSGVALWWALWGELKQTVEATPPEYLALIALVILGLILLGVYRDKITRLRRFRLRRGHKMTKEERKEYLRETFGDAIVESVSKLVYEGRITEVEEKDFYRKSDKRWFLCGQLLAQKAEGPSRWWRKKAKAVEPTIPGPKPGEVDHVATFPSRPKWGDKFLRLKAS